MSTPVSILVVEDDPTINQAVTDRLVAEGFSVHQAFDGPGAVSMFTAAAPDLVVLDVMLPGASGFDLLRALRAKGTVPGIMLSARNEEADRVLGLR